MSEIDLIVTHAAEVLRPLLEEAYNAGYKAGYRAGGVEAIDKFKSRMADMFDAASVAVSTIVNEKVAKPDNIEEMEAADQSDRATPGTVKPAILHLIKESRLGMTTRQIADVTGFKYNSVRGTVWTLQKDGEIAKGESGRWIATPVGTNRQMDINDLVGVAPPPKANEPPND